MLMWTPGLGELIIIFVIVLILFGGKKLPDLAKGLGQGIFEFRKGVSGQDLEKPPELTDKEEQSNTQKKSTNSKES